MEDSNIKVVCRFRPLNEKEKSMSKDLCVNFLSDQTVSINSSSQNIENHKFTFDVVFPPTASQESIYEVSAKPIVEAVMQGFNGTIFAYGQTSSGKTFTMTGDLENYENMGIIPRMVSTVFDTINYAESDIEFTVKVGYCEIYLEKIKDLLDTTKNNLKVHQDRTRGVYIEGLSEHYVSSDQEVYEIMKIGSDNREVASTNMNAGSSRSHSIFIITVSQINSNDYSGKVGKLYLVDLAGSEKVGKTLAEGKRLKEANNINKSLTALGQVINSLTDGKSIHVPYRDSKLTRVLQDSLGGNSKTSLIVTCSPSPYNDLETISTLRFGMRAKAIKNKPKVNREYTLAELKVSLSKAQEEIEKRDRIITKLEESLKNVGESLPELSFSYGPLNNIDEKFSLDEIIAELNEFKGRLSQEIEKNASLREKNSKINEELINTKASHTKSLNLIQTLQDQTAAAEALVKEQEGFLEKLVLTKENLENSIQSMTKEKIDLLKTLSDQEIQIKYLSQQLSMKDSSSISNKNKEILIQIEQEKENNKLLQTKYADLEVRYDELCNLAITNINNEQEKHLNLSFQREKAQ